MDNKKTSYLEKIAQEVEEIFYQNMDDMDEIRAQMLEYIPAKLKESFKNGLEVGQRQRTGQGGQTKKPYRKFRK